MVQKNEKEAPKLEQKKVALALQGGGSHGAFTWGVLDKLLEDGRLEIEGLSGTSAGGMNAVSVLQGLMKGGNKGAREELKAFWKTISEVSKRFSFKNLFTENLPEDIKHFQKACMSSVQNFYSPYQLNPLNINPLHDMVKEFFDFKNLQKFKGPKVFLCATHVNSGKLKIFRKEDLSLDVLLASACLPFLFHAIKVQGEYYWDGGFVGNPAIYPLIYECETPDIIVVQLTVMHRSSLPKTAQQIIDRHKEITYNSCLMREMRSINFISNLIDKGELDPSHVKRTHMHLIRNEEMFSQLELSSALNADFHFLEDLFQKGRHTAEVWLQENFDNIGIKTTAEIQKDFVE